VNGATHQGGALGLNVRLGFCPWPGRAATSPADCAVAWLQRPKDAGCLSRRPTVSDSYTGQLRHRGFSDGCSEARRSAKCLKQKGKLIGFPNASAVWIFSQHPRFWHVPLRHFAIVRLRCGHRQRLEIFIHPPISEAAVVNLVGASGDASLSVEVRVYSSLAQWAVLGIRASAEPIRIFNTETTNQMRFAIEVQRKSNFYIRKVFLPLLLMVVLSWTVFWIDNSELNSQVTISVTTILTVIAFAFAISSNLPKVPYLTFIDVFFLSCYVFVFITAIELTLVHLAGRNQRDKMGRTIRRFSRIALPVLFVITNLLMIAIYYG
jgi:hypothetical protein